MRTQRVFCYTFKTNQRNEYNSKNCWWKKLNWYRITTCRKKRIPKRKKMKIPTDCNQLHCFKDALVMWEHEHSWLHARNYNIDFLMSTESTLGKVSFEWINGLTTEHKQKSRRMLKWRHITFLMNHFVWLNESFF